MITFKNVQELLPYDRKQYKSGKKWFGVSFQLPGVFEGKDIGLELYLEHYHDWFTAIILNFDRDNNEWIVNHDYPDNEWLPNSEDNLKGLRDLFKRNSIPNTFTGAILFTTDDLLKLSKDLITYPYTVFNQKGLLYNDLDISYTKLPLILKISGHLTIDLLSTEIEILRKAVNENAGQFIIKEYHGTAL